MIGNLLNVLVGLWLAYSAIFEPRRATKQCGVGGCRRCHRRLRGVGAATDPLGWQSGMNIVLAAALLVVALVRWVISVAPLVSFWIILLVGIAVAIAAMWSMLYRPNTAQSRALS